MSTASTQQISPEEAVRRVAQAREALVSEVHKVIIGQDEMIEQMLICLFARGHCLTIGVPGLAKTLTVATLAQALRMKFSRIQFTPDLMPSDITGTEIIDQDPATGQRTFRFVRGPVFANIVLADEINRTPPKTQAALLQAMQEYEVTVAGQTYKLEQPFFVMATQNPIEQEGTYPLPEAQLDRFMLSINIGYPTRAEEREIVMSTTQVSRHEVRAVLHAQDILWIQQLVRAVPASQHMVDYAVDLVRATRPKEPPSPEFVKNWLAWGAGPRAAQYLILGAKARAIMHGRYAVTAEDIRALAFPVLRHRIFTNFNADAEGIDVDQIIEKLLETVPEPTYGEKISPKPKTDRQPAAAPAAAPATAIPQPAAAVGLQAPRFGPVPAPPTAPVAPTGATFVPQSPGAASVATPPQMPTATPPQTPVTIPPQAPVAAPSYPPAAASGAPLASPPGTPAAGHPPMATPPTPAQPGRPTPVPIATPPGVGSRAAPASPPPPPPPPSR